MELLRNEDGLIDEINKDAQSKADSIINKAKKQADRMAREADADVAKLFETLRKHSLASIEAEKRRIISTVDIELNKRQLKLLGDMVDQVFDEEKRRLSSEHYLPFFSTQIKEVISLIEKDGGNGEFILEVDHRIIEKMGKDQLLRVIADHGGKVIGMTEKPLDHGLMIYNGTRTISGFISMDHFFEQLKEMFRNDVYRIIIGEKE